MAFVVKCFVNLELEISDVKQAAATMWPAKLSSSRYFMRSWISYAIAGLILLDVLSVVFLGGHIHSARIFIFRKKDLPPLFVQYSSTGTNVKLWVNPRLSQDTTFSEWTIDPDAIERTIDQHRPNVRVLVLTPMKDSSKHLSLYFALLDRMTYPKSLMSLGILEGDSSDDTYDKVYSNFEDLIRRGEYRRLTLIKKNFRNGNKALTGKERHGFAIQGQRRSVQAKCRNHLQSIALADEEVVLWLDSDLRQYPSDIIERMLATKKPIVSADCIQSDGYCYDRNNWRETGASLAFKQRLRPDELMFEGYPEVMLTHRESLCDIKTGIDGNGLVEIDGVGGTALMIYSDLIREGLFFPTFPFGHAIETEGVAQVAQAMGVKVYGLANLKVFHDAA